jgi:predicted nucleic acid-binding protein
MPAAFLPDTSRMIAAVCSWHEYHEAAANEIERRLAGREKMIVAAPALVEAYAVLTRLPPPHGYLQRRLWRLLEKTFLESATVVALNAKSYTSLLLRAAKNGVAGGRTYDAVIGTCAEQGKASTVLTFNAGDFTGLGKDFAVVIPGSV